MDYMLKMTAQFLLSSSEWALTVSVTAKPIKGVGFVALAFARGRKFHYDIHTHEKHILKPMINYHSYFLSKKNIIFF